VGGVRGRGSRCHPRPLPRAWQRRPPGAGTLRPAEAGLDRAGEDVNDRVGSPPCACEVGHVPHSDAILLPRNLRIAGKTGLGRRADAGTTHAVCNAERMKTRGFNTKRGTLASELVLICIALTASRSARGRPTRPGAGARCRRRRADRRVYAGWSRWRIQGNHRARSHTARKHPTRPPTLSVMGGNISELGAPVWSDTTRPRRAAARAQPTKAAIDDARDHRCLRTASGNKTDTF
jgi:hypothetical protein